MGTHLGAVGLHHHGQKLHQVDRRDKLHEGQCSVQINVSVCVCDKSGMSVNVLLAMPGIYATNACEMFASVSVINRRRTSCWHCRDSLFGVVCVNAGSDLYNDSHTTAANSP